MKRLDGVGVLLMIGLVAVMALTVWLRVSRFNECRAHGFSVWYCVNASK